MKQRFKPCDCKLSFVEPNSQLGPTKTRQENCPITERLCCPFEINPNTTKIFQASRRCI